MESWNAYPQNSPGTPSSAWLCPQNNNQGSDWLHSQNNPTERERHENTALATPTRFIMEYNDLNQNSSSSSYFERLFEHNFLKLGNQEDLLNNGVYSNEDFSSFLNSNETGVPVTTVPNISVSIPTTTSNGLNSPTPSLVTDDGKDQLYNLSNDQLDRYPIVTSSIPAYIADDDQRQRSLATRLGGRNNNNNQQKTASSSSPVSPVTTNSSPTSPIMVNRERQRINCPVTTSSSSYPPLVDNKDLYFQERLYPSTLSMNDTTLLTTSQNQDQYLQSRKHDPKQLLLPLTVGRVSTDNTMTVAITSPSSSIDTDDDIDQYDQRKTKTHRQGDYQDFQLSMSTDDLPIQQPSPASSSDYLSSGTKSPPSSHETTPKGRKHRSLQRKRNPKFHEGTLITPVDESHSDKTLIVATSSGQSSTTVGATMPTESGQSLSTTSSNVASTTSASNSDASISCLPSSSDDPTTLTSCVGIKRNVLDDGHDESPEEKRARLLERNRIAAAKCRQKKKQAQESLQHQASDLTQKNTGLHSLVNDLREESLRLKNQLLAHSTCNCNVIQEYVRTSGQFAFARPPYTK